MKVTSVTKKKGAVVENITEYLRDPFEELVKDGVRSELTYNFHASLPFGEVGVGVTVKLVCDQNKETLDKAAELAFNTCIEYAIAGADKCSVALHEKISTDLVEAQQR